MKSLKIIGILGGMGPSASADLYQKILEYAQRKYGAIQDNEYPAVIMRSIPLDGFDETGVKDEELVKKQLMNGLRALERDGCHVIVIPCNTVHYYFNEMQASVKVPILNIGEETIKRVSNKKFKKVGLLCSQTTRDTHFYQKECSKADIEAIEPNDQQQKIITTVIEHVMGGNQNNTDKEVLVRISSEYVNNGAQAVLLACTEIPLAITQPDTDIMLFDSTRILAESAVDFVM